MYTVKLSINAPAEGLLRQTPNNSGVWRNYKFFINQEVEECDFFVVYSKGVKYNETTRVSPNNTIFISGEPECIYHYDKKFLRQFNTVVTSQRITKHPKIIYSHPAQPWRVGRIDKDGKTIFKMGFDELASFKGNSKHKQKKMSVIISNKVYNRDHLNRIKFVEKLKKHYQDKLDVFGIGFNAIEDKWDAIADYKYHIVLENSSYLDYWTEKLADCYLAGSFPFYYGCKNIDKYFPPNSYIPIDINDFAKTIEVIDQSIENNTYEKNIELIEESRNLVLYKYNLFELICSICDLKNPHEKKQQIKLRHELSFLDIHKLPLLAKRVYFKGLKKLHLI